LSRLGWKHVDGLLAAPGTWVRLNKSTQTATGFTMCKIIKEMRGNSC
jgi:hypothetical protein